MDGTLRLLTGFLISRSEAPSSYRSEGPRGEAAKRVAAPTKNAGRIDSSVSSSPLAPQTPGMQCLQNRLRPEPETRTA